MKRFQIDIKIIEYVSQRALFPLPGFTWKLIPSKLKYETEALKARERVELCGRQLIAAARSRNKNTDDSESFVNYLLKAEEGVKLTDAEVISNILTMFVAGSDTTAVGISWAFYFLSLHPEAMEAARAEANELDDSKHNPPLTATEKLSRLRYCYACFTEAMRLRGSVMWVLLQSVSGEDYTLSCGLRINGKDTIALALDAVKRDPVVFEEPERYYPQRWLTEDEEKLRAMKEYCMSFGGGPRVCPGADLAMAEGAFAIANMVTRYTWKLACEPHEVKRIVTLTVQVEKMPFVFTPL